MATPLLGSFYGTSITSVIVQSNQWSSIISWHFQICVSRIWGSAANQLAFLKSYSSKCIEPVCCEKVYHQYFSKILVNNEVSKLHAKFGTLFLRSWYISYTSTNSWISSFGEHLYNKDFLLEFFLRIYSKVSAIHKNSYLQKFLLWCNYTNCLLSYRHPVLKKTWSNMRCHRKCAPKYPRLVW